METLLPFLKEIDRLKTVERQTLIHSGGRRENSAEHSWHLAMAVMVCHSHAEPGTDLLRSLKMALLHDVVEIDAGDTFIYGDMSAKQDDECAAINRITSLLPADVAKELQDLWHEFEARKTPEARFVAALDRFLPMYSNHLNDGYSWKNHGVSVEQVVKKTKPPINEALPELWKLAEGMIATAAEAGHLK